ncbi:MAG: type II/IV secretion system protein, partial [Pirellulales bacterium]
MEIGQIFIERRLADPAQVDAARRDANGRRVAQILVDRGIVPEEDALRALADELQMRFQPLDDIEIDRAVLARFPPTAVFRHAVLPLYLERGSVVAATSDPFDLEALDELSAVGSCRIQPVLSCRADILRAIKTHLGVGGDTINQLVAQRAADGIEVLDELDENLGELAESAQAPSVIKLVNELLIEALEQRASDIHLEPQEEGLVVRYRIDGILRVQPMPGEVNQFHSAIVTRL